MTNKVGLVTVLFNSVPVLPGFFESLARQQFNDYWLYIVDNSIDELSFLKSEELIAQYGMKNVTLIRNSENVGVAKGNNQGIQLSLELGCEYVLLLNNDIEFKDENLLGNMVALADERQESLIVPKIYFHDSGKIWCAGGELSNWTAVTTHRGEGDVDNGQYNHSEYVGYAPTCFMLIHRRVFDAIGQMDEKYFVYYDDTDFVWRAKVAKFNIYYWWQGVVSHKVSSSTGGSTSNFTVYYAHRNRIYFIRKNYTPMVKVISLAYYFLTRPAKWVLFTKKFRKSFFSAISDGLKM